MFDITSSKLLILAIVALIVVGPKDLPLLLRTVGKYLGMIRRQAAEFRAQFDEVLREAELDQVKKDFEDVGRQMRSSIEQSSTAIDSPVEPARPRAEPAVVGSGAAAVPHFPGKPDDAAALPAPTEHRDEPGTGAP